MAGPLGEHGGGFRGGPFFPAIYIGAGIGGIATLTTPTTSQGAVSAGITAAIVYLAHPKWPATLAIGVLLRILIGGAQAIPLAVVAAAVAKALPGVRDATQPTGAQHITRVS